MKIAFFASSIVSAYWNGAATYYRGLLKEMAKLGHQITVYEPDAYDRHKHRDIPDPDWARIVVFSGTSNEWQRSLEEAAHDADVIVKASNIGVLDRELEEAVPAICSASTVSIYCDVDAPATLDDIGADPNHHLRKAIPRYDLVITYGGGQPVIDGYETVGARSCVPIYNALDPATHHPVPARDDYRCDIGFLGNRMPDREARVEEFFLKAAARLPNRRFLLGGSGWQDKSVPANVHRLGHVGTADHNSFFCSGLATLNINRASMATYGFSPPTRVFEAAGAGACLITDKWTGIEMFLEPNQEVLVAASGDEVADILSALTPARAQRIAEAAQARVLAHHTYAHRARQFDALLNNVTARGEAAE